MPPGQVRRPPWGHTHNLKCSLLVLEEVSILVGNSGQCGATASITDWQTEVVRRGERLDQRVNCVTFLPVLPQISPITSEKSGLAGSWQTRRHRRPDTGAFISLGPDGSAALTPPLMRNSKEGRGGDMRGGAELVKEGGGVHGGMLASALRRGHYLRWSFQDVFDALNSAVACS